MWYEFYCDTCKEQEDILMNMNNYTPIWNGLCGHSLRRIFSVPVIAFPETSAVEVLNRHARGEGDPLAGYTQEQTKWMANEKARIQKREKGQKSGGGPSQSFPGGGAVSRVYGD